VFNNIKIAGPLISKMPEAYGLPKRSAPHGSRSRAPGIPIPQSFQNGLRIRPTHAKRCYSTTTAAWSPIPTVARAWRWSML
jgi:hypothetical protein